MDRNITNENQTTLGHIEISQETLEIISGIAVNEVNGVEAMSGNFTSEVSAFFGHKDHKRGVSLSTTDYGQLAVDVYCYLQYGVRIPEIVREIQENIKNQVLFMTNIDLAEVNVHIVDIVPGKSNKSDKDTPASRS